MYSIFYVIYSKQTYAFVFYEDSSSSEEAISAMDGRDFMGSIISVKLAKEDTSRDNNNNNSFQHSDRERDNTNQPRKNRLMVSNLDPRTSWQDLKGIIYIHITLKLYSQQPLLITCMYLNAFLSIHVDWARNGQLNYYY